MGVRPDVVTRTPVRTVGWELRVVLPADEAFAPVARARERLWWILAGLAALCAIGTWIGMHFLLRPLATLRASMKALREDIDADPAEIDTRGSDERGELAREFVLLLHDLRARRAEIAAVADASPLGFFRSDARGYLSYVNDAYLQIHGIGREQAADGWLQLVREETRASVWKDWQLAVREPRPFHLVRKIARADGSVTVLRIRTAPLLVNGQLEGHVGTVADITQESAAENAMRLLAAIFEATTDYVVQADARGRITYMNLAARRISGLGADEAIGHRDFSDFNTPETNELFARVIVPAVKANGIWVGDTTIYNHQRHPIPVSHMVLAHRDKSGRIEHYSAVMRDISAQVSDQRSLQRQAATLRSITEAIPAIVASSMPTAATASSTAPSSAGAARRANASSAAPLTEVLGPLSTRQTREWINRVMAGETVHFESRYQHADGIQHLAISYIPLCSATVGRRLRRRLAGHHAPSTGTGPPAPACAARRPDRPAEPGRLRGTPRTLPRRRRGRRPRAAVHRPRSLQAGQRPVRPSGRRSRAAGLCRPHARARSGRPTRSPASAATNSRWS